PRLAPLVSQRRPPSSLFPYTTLFRSSTLDGPAFRASEIGRRLTDASPADARAMLEHCPTALIFGAWDSTGPRGGMSHKFQRTLRSEEHTSELQSRENLVCRLLLEKQT